MSEPERASIRNLLAPRSVAVLGASRRPDSIGGAVFANLLRHGFRGPVYPINPSADHVQSVRAYASLADVPGPVDLAVITVPRAKVLAAARDCAAHGVRGMVVITAGFREVGEEGRRLEDEVLAVVRAAGMRMVGPNCLGILNADPAVALDATFAPTWPRPGGVAISSQSGALGLAILDLANELGVGISSFLSIGNKADVSGNDLIEYWENDPNTKVILLYLESFGNPRRFTQLARRIGRVKPILAVKSGRTAAGGRAAQSHTGALAGTDLAVEALFRQAGVLRTETIEEQFDTALLLAHQPLPRGPRLAILTNAGGPGIMAADACEGAGLVIPALDPATERGFREFLAPEATTRNPVDMIASARPESFERGVRRLVADSNVDSVLAIFVPPVGTDAPDVARGLLAGATAAREAGKPLLACFMGSHGIPESLRSLQEGHVPSYSFPEAAARALGRVVRYAAWRARPEGRLADLAGIDASAGARAVARAQSRLGADGGWMPPDDVEALLVAYGLRTPPSQVATDVAGAVAAARAIGYPVALKLVSETLTHKSDVGGVRLGLADDAAVADGWARLVAALAVHGEVAAMRGGLVQPMVTGTFEAVIGMTLDPQFGPLLMAGLGGKWVELHHDVAFRLHPLTLEDATEMVDALRARVLFAGYRGAPAGDRAAFEDALLRVSRLVGDRPEIVELDLNPVVVGEPGCGVTAVDARVRVSGAEPAPRG